MDTLQLDQRPAAAESQGLAGPADLPGFKRAARALLARGVPPEQVQWRTADAEAQLFDQPDGPAAEAGDNVAEAGDDAAAVPSTAAGEAGRLSVPAWFGSLCESVVLHRDPQRFHLLYRLLWRLQHEAGLRHDPLDADRVQAENCARAVRRDIHKMRAFVRFRPVTDEAGDGLHVAWFEPEHHIVEANAPFFMRRFAQMRWALLTPERSVRWDGERLEFGPGAKRDDAPAADADEALWLTYYASIFNPARLKLAAMRKEMPRRYWHNLPEAVLIQPLAAAAAERSGTMIEPPPDDAVPKKRRPPAVGPARPAPVVEVQSLADLNQATQACRQCPIGEFATQAVPGEGPNEPRLMLVGEQPGDSEDLRGKPFVGPAGRLLDRALQEIGWPRETLYVTNAVKHFKFELRGKRRMHKTAGQREIQTCSQWLEREIALVKPQALVALGATAARALTGRAVAVMKERGTWIERPDGLRVFITLHPSALLRTLPEDQGAAYAQWVKELSSALPPA